MLEANGIHSGCTEKKTVQNAPKFKGIHIPEVSLPKGGGALKGIDEKFEVNPVNGTASFSLELPITQGRNGFTPEIGLGYNSGSGNSAFGLGWNLTIPSITVKTDKGLPKYKDGEDSYQLSGEDDLVPYLKEVAAGVWENEETIIDEVHRVRRYRPRIEGSFSNLERIVHIVHGTYWKLTTADNVTTILGRSPEARIANPKNDDQIFQWLAEFSYDDKGNWIKYSYKPEDIENVSNEIFEANRLNGFSAISNKYLKRVKYGNRKPYFADENVPYDPEDPTVHEGTENEAHFFELVFDYGEHHELVPTPQEDENQLWNYRPDAFSSYRSRFEIRTNRLCSRILMFHRFEELGAKPYLVKSLDLRYEGSSINQAGGSEVSYLISAEQSGYVRKDDGYAKKSFPPIEFDYKKLEWNKTIQFVDSENIQNAPSGLSKGYQWVDLFNEGISGILTDHNNAWYFKENLGNSEQGIQFTPGKQIRLSSSIVNSDGSAVISDLESNGEKQVSISSDGVQGFYKMNSTDAATIDLDSFTSFKQIPNIDWNDANTRYIDLIGDGKPDIVLSKESVFLWYPNEGVNGYNSAEYASKVFDEEKGPAIVFSDEEESIFLADFTGDGLTDIVRIRNGEICYWANKGYGKFSARISMGNAPVFDHPDQYNPQFLHLADVTGTGVTDIIYLGKNTFRAYLNNSGNAWSDAHEISPFTETNDHGKLSVVDLFGTGTSCIVWSSELPISKPMQYIDLMNSSNPHVLTGYQNNLGKEVSFEYKSSTHYYLKDKKEGTPWLTKLPFPVQVISKTVTEDKITRVRFTSEYSYKHGYYDHEDREFRGFGRTDQIDSELYDIWALNNEENKLSLSKESYQPPLLTKSWFHTGSLKHMNQLVALYESEFWYKEMEKAGYAVVNNEITLNNSELRAIDQILDAEAISKLSPKEKHEAARTLKGTVLRTETFALDSDENSTEQEKRKAFIPFTVTLQNGHIQFYQPRKNSNSGVFLFSESEVVNYNYEREADDPRVVHTLNTKVNYLGRTEEMATVVYPRLIVDGDLSKFVQDRQARTQIIYSKHSFTNDAISSSFYRLRELSETLEFELTDITKTKSYYQLEDFDNVLSTASSAIAYEVDLMTDIDPFPGLPKRRLIEHSRTLFLSDDLSTVLELHVLESKGLLHESYRLAYTPDLLIDIFGGKIVDAELTMSGMGYIHFAGDENWWIPSGFKSLINTIAGETQNDGQSRFYHPIAYVDPLGNQAKLTYYRDYFLQVEQVEDALNNITKVEAINFRTMTNAMMRDQNDTLTAVIHDELGIVKATALLGKDLDNDLVAEFQLSDNLDALTELTDNEQLMIDSFFATENSNDLQAHGRDLLKNATQRFVYDLGAYQNNGKPVVLSSIVRETHAENLQVGEETKMQISFEYKDGSGKVAMMKSQAEPGIAKQLNTLEDETIQIDEVDTSKLVPSQLRWVGSGRTVLNNKGNVVKQYEPYFSVTPFFEDASELVETGVTPIIFYDSLDRVIKTVFPNGTFSVTEIFPWKQLMHDENDTVLDSTWYSNRVNRLIDAELIALGKDPETEESSALKAEKHHGTPRAVHFDTLRNEILVSAHNKDEAENDVFHETQIELDIEGNNRRIHDARGNAVVSQKYSMLGDSPYSNSMDAGERWILRNVLNKAVKKWDGRNHELQLSYDQLHRPLEIRLIGGEGAFPINKVVDKIVYGEGVANDKKMNLRGQVINHFDTAGKLTFSYDLKGNVLSETRRFAMEYKQTPDWDVADLEALLEVESFVSSREYDALNRSIGYTTPDGTKTSNGFNEANLLDQVSVEQNGQTEIIVENIDYDEKGQKSRIAYGNGVVTKYNYDHETFRLLRLSTRKPNNELIQDLLYTFDPVGNVLEIENNCIPTTFFGNHVIEPRSLFTYDALYQLIEAEGREHSGQQLNLGTTDNYSDAPFLKQYNANDPMAWRQYKQSYQYDHVGNIEEIKHNTADPGKNWTRVNTYAPNNNRIVNSSIEGNVYNYSHHASHGFLTDLPHLHVLEWNFRDELQAVSKQKVNTGTPETTYYVYDASGKRVRKVTENQAGQGIAPTLKEERIYIGEFETYRFASSGLERTSIHISDDSGRIAMIDTRNEVNDGTDKRTVRYQLGNHLNSASIELDEQARIISYEEFHPFGTSAYQAITKDIKVAAKRYRYTGMERDNESGLSYHSARYYVPWLGRWMKPDPAGLVDGTNLFRYAKNNPVKFNDPSGNIPDNAIGDKMFDRMVNPPPSAPAPPPKPSPPPPPSKIYKLDKSTGKAVLMTHAAAQKALGLSSKDFEKAIGKGKVFIYRNNRLSTTSQKTVDEINDPSKATPLMAFAIEKLQADTAKFKGNFPKDYYVEFSKAVMKKSIQLHGADKGVTKAAGAFGSEDMEMGYAALHLYEGLARSNSNTGFDKVQHFVASANIEYSIVSNYTAGLWTDAQQYGKEIFYDEIPSWFGDDIGYDKYDMLANNRGQAFGAKLYEKYHPVRNNPGKAAVKATSDAVNNTLYEAERWIRWKYGIPNF